MRFWSKDLPIEQHVSATKYQIWNRTSPKPKRQILRPFQGLFKLYNGKFDGQLLFDRGILYFEEDGKSNDELPPTYNEVEKQVYTELGFGSLGEAIANSSPLKVNRLVQQRLYEKRGLSDVTKVYRFL